VQTRLTGKTKEVVISNEHPTVLIGERINPTGKKKMAQALKNGDLELVKQEAIAQVQASADVIDINVATFGVDEVSMLRADLLDAIDAVLRHVRRQKNSPFGGIQILFIGDLLQLPPVVQDEEWDYLAPYYPGLNFFYAKALQNNPPLYIELEKIYRQSDIQFISLQMPIIYI